MKDEGSDGEKTETDSENDGEDKENVDVSPSRLVRPRTPHMSNWLSSLFDDDVKASDRDSETGNSSDTELSGYSTPPASSSPLRPITSSPLRLLRNPRRTPMNLYLAYSASTKNTDAQGRFVPPQFFLLAPSIPRSIVHDDPESTVVAERYYLKKKTPLAMWDYTYLHDHVPARTSDLECVVHLGRINSHLSVDDVTRAIECVDLPENKQFFKYADWLFSVMNVRVSSLAPQGFLCSMGSYVLTRLKYPLCIPLSWTSCYTDALGE